VLGGDGKIAQKMVDTYTTQGADIIVTGGIADGDQVVTSGMIKLHPGALAKVAAPAAAPGAAPGANSAATKPAETKH
jgi:membrane fusion protein (multidrug efflux system)